MSEVAEQSESHYVYIIYCTDEGCTARIVGTDARTQMFARVRARLAGIREGWVTHPVPKCPYHRKELIIMPEPIDASDPEAIAELIRQDQEEWPMGHPCRSCGCVYVDHPNTKCAAWS